MSAKWQALRVEMPKAWREVVARLAEVENREGGILVDVSLNKVGHEYLQLVGTRVSQTSQVPLGMRAIEIPPQKYVHHRHVGPVAGIAESFGLVYGWAREHGHAFKLDFRYTVKGGEPEHDLYVALLPIKPWRDVGEA